MKTKENIAMPIMCVVSDVIAVYFRTELAVLERDAFVSERAQFGLFLPFYELLGGYEVLRQI